MAEKQFLTVTVTLPKKLAYRPGYNNHWSVYVKSVASVYTWILKDTDYEYAVDTKEVYKYATTRKMYQLLTRMPYERPEAPSRSCPSWWHSVELQKPFQPQCPLEYGE